MRRRHVGRESLRDYSASVVMGVVEAKLNTRFALLTPCPLDPMVVVNHQFTEEEHKAIATLRGKGLLTTRDEIQINIDVPVNFDIPPEWQRVVGVVPGMAERQIVAKNIRLKLAESVPMFATVPHYNRTVTTLNLSRQPSVFYDAALEWAKQYMTVSLQTHATKWKINRLFGICNTMGQVKRLWPSVVSFLPQEAQDKLQQQKARSRLPPEAYVVAEDGDRLSPEWHPETLAYYEGIITEALLLPDADEATIVAHNSNTVNYAH